MHRAMKARRRASRNVCQVFAKVWHQDRERVLEYVLRRVAGDSDAEADDSDATSLPTSVAPIGDGSVSEEGVEKLSLELESSQSREPPLADAGVSLTPGDDAIGAAQPASYRYFEFRGGASNKFWEITWSGTRHPVRFGRIGAAGQEAVKDESRARQDSETLIRQKLAKGY
jgi:predicted DNA-binding WGR domain protein